MKSLLSMLAITAVALFATIGCGDKGSDGNVVAATPITANYYYVNKGVCYDDSRNVVDNRNCDGLLGYYQVNGYCYNPSNVRVQSEYCQKIPSRVRNVCDGDGYYSVRRGKKIAVKCDRRGCQGRRVYDRHDRMILCRS